MHFGQNLYHKAVSFFTLAFHVTWKSFFKTFLLENMTQVISWNSWLMKDSSARSDQRSVYDDTCSQLLRLKMDFLRRSVFQYSFVPIWTPLSWSYCGIPLLKREVFNFHSLKLIGGHFNLRYIVHTSISCTKLLLYKCLFHYQPQANWVAIQAAFQNAENFYFEILWSPISECFSQSEQFDRHVGATSNNYGLSIKMT